MERAGVDTIGKQQFTALYGPARAAAFTKRNIFSEWSKAGLFPFNPDKVLRDMPKPPPEALTADREQVLTYIRNATTSGTPATPATPVSVEALTSLQKIILSRDAKALDEASKQDLNRHLRRLAKAAHSSFAEATIQKDQIRFLLKANDEAKARRATKSIVLGKAKVMSFEDLVEARSKRLEEEAAKDNSKAKAGEKRNAAAREPVPVELVTMGARLSEPEQNPSVATSLGHGQMILADTAGVDPFVVPVAKMW